MPHYFSTKAGTLHALRDRLTSAKIAPLVFFTTQQWQQNPAQCLATIQAECPGAPWIVRSSCLAEDGATHSNAGAFLSVLNVTQETLKTAIDQVVASYPDACDENEVLIQPMLKQVVRSGVAFTHDPNTCAPYRVINWAEGTDTEAITSGQDGYTYQQAALSPYPAPAKLAGVMGLLEELLTLFNGTPIDCEFAITQNPDGTEHVWLLQARPLVLPEGPESPQAQAARLKKIEAKLTEAMAPHPFLKGNRTVYGVMPDWNPAEIVGIRPKPLALSLYRELVTDSTWAYQRHNYGYRNLRSFPLMPHFFGLPYIDVRLSFNSFIPADLDEKLAGRLVDHYINRLLDEPTLHDKVEFEIVYSCYTLDLPERLAKLSDYGFSHAEQATLAESLRQLTNRITHPEEGLWRSDASKLDVLNQRREELMQSAASPIERIYWLIEDAKRYGSLPFAGLARAGFVAVQMLRSLVTTGVFSQSDYDGFMASVSTVSKQLARDQATLDKTTFLSRYGHLRPGTYDILSYRYDECPDLYFDWNSQRPAVEHAPPFSLTLPQMREISRLLQHHGLHQDPVALFDFLQAGIELRELAKFHFTRNLSDAMSLIVEVGAQLGISRDDLAYADMTAFKELYIAATDPKALILQSIAQGKERYAETLKLALPSLIVEPSSIWGYPWPKTEPNYITQKQVTASVVTHTMERSQLKGAIVCIPNADPGFDWLFSYPIAGLITTWGGTNSHMAIRAGELGLPAIIGAGESYYQKWSSAKRLHLDCAGRRVEVLS